jgi:hypothetical protein
MAFPNLISGTSFFNTVNRCGPYQHGSNLYVVSQDALLPTVTQVWKSTDQGVTWTEMDIAHEPVSNGNDQHTSSCANGSLIYVHNSNLSVAQISIFNMATDTWSSVNVSTILVARNFPTCVQFRTSDSKLVIGACIAAFETAHTNQRAGVYTFDTVGLTFSTVTQIGELNPSVLADVMAIEVVRGQGRFHFLLGTVFTNGTTPTNLSQQAYSDLGVVGTLAVIVAGPQTLSSYTIYPAATSDGTNITVYNPDPSTGLIAVFRGASADPITFASLGSVNSTFGGYPLFLDFKACFNSSTTFLFALGRSGGISTVLTWSDAGSGFGSSSVVGTSPTSFTNIFCGPVTGASNTWAILLQGSTYYFAGGAPTPVSVLPLTSQVAFMGVRRVQGKDPLIPSFKFRPKTYIYNAQAVLTATGVDGAGNPATAVTLIVPIVNYDFELYQLRLRYRSAAGVFQDPTQPFAKLWIYDSVGQQISNLPILDMYVNGLPLSKYDNGAMVPVLLYPNQSQIRIDFLSVVKNAMLLPLTCYADLVGVQRQPCA